MERRKKQMPGQAACTMGALLGCAQPGCAMLAIFVPSACAPPHRQNGKERREGAKGATLVRAQREVISLSALSSSSLMALYFIFCA